MSVTGDLADFVTRTSYADLPPLAVEHAKVVLASTLASAAMGSTIVSANIFRELSEERGGTPEASIWFSAGPQLPVMDAARTNAVMSDSAASDDTDLRGAGHIGTVTSTAAVAMAERAGATGKGVLEAIVLGYEVAGRIGERVRPGELGFHPGVITIFGATVAAGKVMGLTRDQMTHALSLAATSIGGIGVAANTSWAREYDAGLASTLAFTAVQTAEKGFFAEERVLEMPRGYFETYRGHDIEHILDTAGETWGIVTDLAVKLVPGTWAYHSLVEATINDVTEGNIAPDEIERISVSGRRFGGHMWYHPTELVGVAHSLPYMLAAAAVDREYTWSHATTPAKFLDPIIGAVQDKVVGEEEPSPFAQRGGGTVTVVTTDGRSYSSTIEAPRGSGPRGIDWADIDAKYRGLVPLSGLAPDRLETSLEVIHRFEDVASVSELLGLLQVISTPEGVA